MARRSDHTAEELKALAIRKGLEIIDKNGFQAFSARACAAAMGYSVGTLYHVFGDLDHFMLHINAAILDSLHADLERGLRNASKDPLRYLARAYVDFARGHQNRWQMLFEFRMNDMSALPSWYAEKMARMFSLVEAALRPVAGKDSLRAARVLWAGIHGICVLSLSGKLDLLQTEKPEILVNDLIENYLSGLGKNAG